MPGLRLSMTLLDPSRAYVVSLDPPSKAMVRIPAAALAALSGSVCNSMLLAKAVNWAVATDARPMLNSNTSLLANLTSLAVGTRCNTTLRLVRNEYLIVPSEFNAMTDPPGLSSLHLPLYKRCLSRTSAHRSQPSCQLPRTWAGRARSCWPARVEANECGPK
jgi:hypothetical protein